MTPFAAAVPDALGSLIARGDYWRRSAGAGLHPGFKEWSHFCILAEDLTLLVNWSVAARGEGGPLPRLTLLVRTADGAWDGDAEQFDPRELRMPGGQMAADLGSSRLRFRNGAFEMTVRLARRPIQADLRLRPRSRPALTSSVPLGRRAAMKWFVVPRLEAEGEVRIGSRRVRLARAPAYHDHDWGEFAWGGDFSWEWGIAVPGDSPYSLIFQRISDRSRARTLSQGVLLWRGAEHHRTLHDRQVAVRALGLLRASSALRVPRVMSLASPGRAADLPTRLELSARSRDDRLEGVFELEDLAQVVVPNDGDLGNTVISECHARARFEGRIAGRPLRLAGPAIVEMNRAEA